MGKVFNFGSSLDIMFALPGVCVCLFFLPYDIVSPPKNGICLYKRGYNEPTRADLKFYSKGLKNSFISA